MSQTSTTLPVANSITEHGHDQDLTLQSQLTLALQTLLQAHFDTDEINTVSASQSKLIPCIVAFSTGADSTALLHAAAEVCSQQPWPSRQKGRQLSLQALHINHQLHPDSDQWQHQASVVCQQLKIPLHSMRVAVHNDGRGLEAAARSARYQAFRQQLRDGGILLLAHHLNDQVETVLLHLLRGSGVDGLRGMPACRQLGQAWLLRPWLQFPRTQLHAYCERHHLTFTEDSSNQDTRHDRGWLRRTLLPLLEQRKPAASRNIVHSASLIEHTRSLAHKQLDTYLRTMLTSQSSIAIQALQAHEDPLLQQDLVRHWIKSLGHTPPGRQQLAELLDQLAGAAEDRQPALQQPGYSLRRYQQQLYLCVAVPAFPAAQHWQLPASWKWPGCGELNVHATGDQQGTPPPDLQQQSAQRWPLLIITLRRGGESIKLGDGHHHQVKKLLQTAAIPPWQRQQLPLLWHRNKLVAVADRWLHPALQRWLDQQHLQLQWTHYEQAKNL